MSDEMTPQERREFDYAMLDRELAGIAGRLEELRSRLNDYLPAPEPETRIEIDEPGFGEDTLAAMRELDELIVPRAATPEPAHDYTKIPWSGKRINVRTRDMLRTARELLTAYSWDPYLTQGSYNAGGVAASAGTHDGGGAVDIRTSTMSSNGINLAVEALRKAGFAAWRRTPAEGFSEHIHAIAIGDREMSSGAKNQVNAYFRGRNGLANNGPDSAPSSIGRPYPDWARKYNPYVEAEPEVALTSADVKKIATTDGAFTVSERMRAGNPENAEWKLESILQFIADRVLDLDERLTAVEATVKGSVDRLEARIEALDEAALLETFQQVLVDAVAQVKVKIETGETEPA